MKRKLCVVSLLCLVGLMWFLLMGCAEDISESVPEGKIAFTWGSDIYVMNADGSNSINLARGSRASRRKYHTG